jgi:predicted dehydrogenase
VKRLIVFLVWALSTAASARAQTSAAPARFRLVTLDPGHFHASLVQKFMYADVDPVVHVYAPPGDDVAEHLKRVESFNRRADSPTHWREEVYTGADFFEKMLAEKTGNVVVISGNNTRKTDYIVRALDAGFHVLADKPMAINAAEFARLQAAFATSAEKHALLYDIMTERFEITTILQRELSRQPALFGEIVPGAPDDPAIVMESIHYFSKVVAGAPLKRPQWFFDVKQEGEAITDVGTHLVDLVQWELFPDKILRPADVEMLRARRWATPITREQFQRVTGAAEFPGFLRADVKDGVLQEFSNTECTYRLRGVSARVVAEWRYEAPAGGDSHHSILRGTNAKLEIRQNAAENFKPVLYVVQGDRAERPVAEPIVAAAVASLQAKFPGVGFRRAGAEWAITVPEKYDVGHEAHFSQVTEDFLGYLRAGRVPEWEIAAMLTKYATTTRAYELSHRP